MASTYSALKIELLETGANSGTWGTATNVNLGDDILGEAITGSATVDFASDADVTITLTNSSTSQSARNLRLNITESSTGVGSVRNLILGSGCQIEKFYLINNTGTGAKTVKNTSGTGISVPAGKATLVYNNGTNVVDAASYFTSLTLGSALPVASGGTNATTASITSFNNITGFTASGATGTTSTNLVFSTSPVLTTPTLGVATATSLQGIIGNVTPAAGSFTTVTASTAIGTSSGGTGLSSFTSGGVVYASSTSALATGSNLYFDGTNLGVGVTSPSQKLELAGVLRVKNGNADTNGLNLSSDAAGVSTINSGYAGAGQIVFQTEGTERMRLTSTGLGIGTTTATAKLTVINTSDANKQIVFSDNATYYGSVGHNSGTGLNEYRTEPSGGHGFFIGTSGTANMTLNSSGNVGIGTSSPQFGVDLRRGSGADAYFLAAGNNNGTTNGILFGQDTSGLSLIYQYGANPITFWTNTSERARITSDGNLLVGTTANTNSAKLKSKVSGGSVGLEITDEASSDFVVVPASSAGVCKIGPTAGAMSFQTAGTERARITSGGALCLNVTDASTAGNLRIVQYAGSGISRIETVDSGTVTIFQFVKNSGGTAEVGSISCTTSATAYNTSSDYRLKNTIAPMTGALAKVALLKPVTYKWNADGSDGEGFIAHELAEVCPYAVTGAKDAVDANGNIKPQGIDVSFLVATLTAAIQELKAEFDAYKASHP